MTDRLHIMAVSLLLLASAACSKQTALETESTGGEKVAYINLSGVNGGVKSTLGADWKVSWEQGDRILYYTMRQTSVSSAATDKQFIVPSEVQTVSVPVTYSDGDDAVMFCTKGLNIGALGSKTSTGFVLTDAVPSAQNGTFADQYVGVVKTGLLTLGGTQPNVTVSPVQSFIRFRMSSTTFGDETVDRIVVKGSNGTEKICGNAQITVGGTAPNFTYSVSLSGDGETSITIDKTSSTFYTDTDYYVAVLPGTYANGLTVQFYHGRNSTSLAKLYLGRGGLTLSPGKVLNLGVVNSYKSVPLKRSESAMPAYAAITKDMSKKFWVYVEPSDFNGTLEVTPATEGGDFPPVTIENTGAREMLSDGRSYMMFKVIPTSAVKTAAYKDYDNMPITVKVKDPDGTERSSYTVELNVGNFVDMGTKTSANRKLLWARSNLYGSLEKGNRKATAPNPNKPSTLALDDSTQIRGVYMYGCVNSNEDEGITLSMSTSVSDTKSKQYYGRWGGYKYGIDKGKTILEQQDNVAWQWNHSCRLPYIGEIFNMSTNSITVSENHSGGNVSLIIRKTSDVLGYSDVTYLLKCHSKVGRFVMTMECESKSGYRDVAIYGILTHSGENTGNNYASHCAQAIPVKELDF